MVRSAEVILIKVNSDKPWENYHKRTMESQENIFNKKHFERIHEKADIWDMLWRPCGLQQVKWVFSWGQEVQLQGHYDTLNYKEWEAKLVRVMTMDKEMKGINRWKSYG